MNDKVECEFFIAMDENGEWAVEKDSNDAFSNCIDNGAEGSMRVVKITAWVRPPAPIEAEIDVPDDAGETKPIEQLEAAE